jgi:hypothetical protein
MISDDELILYHYRDGLDAAERARIGAALSEQPELARRLQNLVARLDSAAAMPEVPVPAAVQQRWQEALERAAQRDDRLADTRAPRAGRSFANFRWQAAAAAVAVITLILVIPKKPTEVEPPVITKSPADPGDASAYERGLKVHLASTEQQLAGLDSAKPEERARLIATIIAQNRIYALAAERAGEPQLARVLRAFGPVLEGLEHGDSSASIAQLTFELRVMQGRLGAGAAASGTNSTTL